MSSANLFWKFHLNFRTNSFRKWISLCSVWIVLMDKEILMDDVATQCKDTVKLKMQQNMKFKKVLKCSSWVLKGEFRKFLRSINYISPSLLNLQDLKISFFKQIYLYKHQPHKMVKHTQTISRLLPRNCLDVLDHFGGLALKGLLSKSYVGHQEHESFDILTWTNVTINI